MGQVILAGQGQVPARQAAVHGGIPLRVPANTVNKACLSGLNTIYLAHQMIAAARRHRGGWRHGVDDPDALRASGARAGFRLDNTTLYDAMMLDGSPVRSTTAPWACPPSASTGSWAFRESDRRIRRRIPREGGRRGEGREAG